MKQKIGGYSFLRLSSVTARALNEYRLNEKPPVSGLLFCSVSLWAVGLPSLLNSFLFITSSSSSPPLTVQ